MATRMRGGEHNPACVQELMVTEAVRRGMLPFDLRGHVETCRICMEIFQTAQSLRELVTCDLEEPLPSASSIWWRINLRLRRERRQRAALPIVWMRRLSWATWMVVAMMLLLWQPPQLSIYSATLKSGLLALCAVTLPVSIVLWWWSRSER